MGALILLLAIGGCSGSATAPDPGSELTDLEKAVLQCRSRVDIQLKEQEAYIRAGQDALAQQIFEQALVEWGGSESPDAKALFQVMPLIGGVIRGEYTDDFVASQVEQACESVERDVP